MLWVMAMQEQVTGLAAQHLLTVKIPQYSKILFESLSIPANIKDK